MVQLADVALAHYRLAKWLVPTPLENAPQLGQQVWLKLENANKTHSFKIRGALNAMLALDEPARATGIAAVSSGNHAQGIAYAAHLLGVDAQIVMPTHTPKRKVEGVRRYGAKAILFGATYDEAEHEGRRLERETGLTFISPYNNADVIAGAGTIGLEIVSSLPNLARIIIPVSGGGLVSGVALAVKSLKPDVEVIGVNAESAPAMYNLFYNTPKPQVWDTLAEALSGEIEAEAITIALSKQYIDRIVLVSEDDIADAIRWTVDQQGWIVEGGGAVGIAALLAGTVEADDRPTAVVVSGGNIDGETLRRVLGHR